MKRKRRQYRIDNPVGGYDHASSSSEFYSSSPVEQPLSGGKAPSDAYTVGKTARHEIRSGRGTVKMDPREKMALMAILKSIILIMSLFMAFFMLWKGIKLYEDSIWIENAAEVKPSPLLENVELVTDFDIGDQDSREQFARRIEHWKEAERLVSSADILEQRNIYDQAIKQCQEALHRDPAHLGALERLGRLYYQQGSYVEAVNAYIRLLSVDPSRPDTQRNLIRALGAFGDHAAVKYMAEWYLDENLFDLEVQRLLAEAYFALEEYAAAAEAYDRVLDGTADDISSMEQQVAAWMQIREYEKALVILEQLHSRNHRNLDYYRQMAICNAQMDRAQETVQNLVRANQLFGVQAALMLVQEPLLDPVRDHRSFQSFVDRVGGKEFRLRLEELANLPTKQEHKEIEPMLLLDDEER